MTKFYDAVYSFERVGGYQFVKLYISMFEKWLESPQWLLAVSKPEVRMRVTSAWGQELDFSFILFDLCLLITFFNFIMNYVPIVTFWIFTYHKIWILSIMFCFIWSYWIIYFLACLEVSWRVVS